MNIVVGMFRGSNHKARKSPIGHRTGRKRGFTLAQVLVVMGIMGAMAGASTVSYKAYQRSLISARHNGCDAHMGTIIAAIDSFRNDNRRLPYSLTELVKRGYTKSEELRCPSDTNLAEHTNDPGYSSYANSYIMRDVLDSDQLPILVCPYHADDGGTGEQGFPNLMTRRYKERSATLSAGDWGGTVTLTRNGHVLTLPQAGDPPLLLQGGDHFSIGAGEATVHFADTSTANLTGGTELTVLQSYLQNPQGGSLYTIVYQALGTVNYYVNPGSKFDVSTPTATAGAMGTRFTVIVSPIAASTNLAGTYDTKTELRVTQHKVAYTSLGKTVMVGEGEPILTAASSEFEAKPRRPRPAPVGGLYSTNAGGGTTTSGNTTSGNTTGSTNGGGTNSGSSNGGGTNSGSNGGGTNSGSNGGGTNSGSNGGGSNGSSNGGKGDDHGEDD